jgi:nucleoporin NUP82
MPKVVSYTPAWLSKPAPGYDIFSGSPDARPIVKGKGKGSKPGPKRTIARRGTEVFVAVGKEIRWADLVLLKEDWEEKQARQPKGIKALGEINTDGEGKANGYRVRQFMSSTKSTAY